jgi:indole-3-glycerol phosphate synthase
MPDFLQQMARSSRERVAEARALCSEARLLERATQSPLPPKLAYSQEGFDLLAEVKMRSPAVGQLGSSGEDVMARVQSYAQAGAAAVSVLTEPSRFDGSMEHLETAAQALTPLRVPAMRKDFLVDAYQVLEARAAGAGGVLVIIRMLSDSEIDSLLDCARDMSLFVLLEAFDQPDIERAHALVEPRLAAGSGSAGSTHQLMVGVNCRDLSTLQVVPGRLEELAHMLPARVPRVAESGVENAQDAERLARAGYDLALVGSALMRGNDPQSLIRRMLTAGRAARTLRSPGKR